MVRKSGNNCEHVAAGENKKVVSTVGDFGSAVLAVQNYVANFDVECEMLAFVIAPTARSNCKNGALLWLLFGGVSEHATRRTSHMNLKPLDDRIVVKPSEAVQTTASGLVIPDTAKEKPQQGTVLAVGPGRWSDDEGKHFALDIKVGDVVLYSKYGGTEVTHSGDDLLILTSRDVLAVVA